MSVPVSLSAERVSVATRAKVIRLADRNSKERSPDNRSLGAIGPKVPVRRTPDVVPALALDLLIDGSTVGRNGKESHAHTGNLDCWIVLATEYGVAATR
jgi:hypothetical protein